MDGVSQSLIAYRLRTVRVGVLTQLLVMRQQQAVEINDNVVQGLAVASYALDAGDEARAKAAVKKTLAAARSIVNKLLDVEALRPGDLVRSRSADVTTDDEEASAR